AETRLCAIVCMWTVPAAVVSRQTITAMMAANCTANHAQTPSAPHAIVPSNPHGRGGACAGGREPAEEGGLSRSRYRSRAARARSSSRAWRRLRGALAREWNEIGGIAHRPLADAVAAVPFGKIDMDVIFVKAIRSRAQHGGEAHAGAGLQPLAH